MLFNVTHSNSNFECNKERGFIDQLYIELGEGWRVKYLNVLNGWSLSHLKKTVRILRIADVEEML